MNKQVRGNYLTRFNGLNLTEQQLEQQWKARLEEEEYLAIAESMNARMAAQAIQAGGAAASGSVSISSGCIEFIYNTTSGTSAEFEVTTSGPTNYTITWGDGTEVTDVIDGGVSIEHDYADSDTEYTVRLCFDDISLVTELDFD